MDEYFISPDPPREPRGIEIGPSFPPAGYDPSEKGVRWLCGTN
jgi:hypothetical protein